MERFICVRLARANDLDLRQFQFHRDLTFACFFMNADRTIYARYGMRSDFQKAERDISLAGLKSTMQAVLDFHAGYPSGKELVEAKRDPNGSRRFLPDYPWMKLLLARRPRKQMPCMHCHHIANAEIAQFRSAGKPVPESTIFSYPLPRDVGMKMDRTRSATIETVLPNTPAARAGLRDGDRLVHLAGQAIFSPADIQWVLQQAGHEATLDALIERHGETVSRKVVLEPGWRRRVDISWRPTTHYLRRIVLGGMNLEPLRARGKEELRLKPGAMALRVVRLFNRSPAYRAGVRQGDVLIAYAGHRKTATEADLLVLGLNKVPPGDTVHVTVLRRGHRIDAHWRAE